MIGRIKGFERSPFDLAANKLLLLMETIRGSGFLNQLMLRPFSVPKTILFSTSMLLALSDSPQANSITVKLQEKI
jgi:hypothetical protein